VTVIILIITSPLMTYLAAGYESSVPFAAQLPDRNATIIVLAGGTVRPGFKSSNWQQYRYMGQSARFWEALRIARHGEKINLMLSIGLEELPEGESMQQLSLEVMRHDPVDRAPLLHLFGPSRNTHDELLHAKKMIEEKNLPRNIYLVTSAYHMQRALAVFAKEFPQIQALPVDHKIDLANDGMGWGLGNVHTFSSLLHEWIGQLAYKLTGRS
jgi:uncharacterized SAM-binding protein YcdF (DUF218 family)